MNSKKTGHNNPTCQEEESQNHKCLECGEINTEKDENSNYCIDTLFETEEKVIEEHEPEEMVYNIDSQMDDGAILDNMIDDKEICENMLVKETFEHLETGKISKDEMSQILEWTDLSR